MEPRRNHVPVKTIPGITKLSYFEWPIEGPFVGYIQAQTLPHIGEWSHFSPTDITKLIEKPLHKPTPKFSDHTKSDSMWNFSVVRTEGTIMNESAYFNQHKKKTNHLVNYR